MYAQRAAFRQNRLTKERCRCLESIGFAWDAAHLAWNKRLRELKAFRRQNGHLPGALSLAGESALGLWEVSYR